MEKWWITDLQLAFISISDFKTAFLISHYQTPCASYECVLHPVEKTQGPNAPAQSSRLLIFYLIVSLKVFLVKPSSKMWWFICEGHSAVVKRPVQT